MRPLAACPVYILAGFGDQSILVLFLLLVLIRLAIGLLIVHCFSILLILGVLLGFLIGAIFTFVLRLDDFHLFLRLLEFFCPLIGCWLLDRWSLLLLDGRTALLLLAHLNIISCIFKSLS